MASRQAHNLKVAGSNPAPATTLRSIRIELRVARQIWKKRIILGLRKVRSVSRAVPPRSFMRRAGVPTRRGRGRSGASEEKEKMYFVYIMALYGGKKYIGFTANLKSRLAKHRSAPTQTTRNFPVKQLLFYCAFVNKSDALLFEKYLKSSSGCAFRKKHHFD